MRDPVFRHALAQILFYSSPLLDVRLRCHRNMERGKVVTTPMSDTRVKIYHLPFSQMPYMKVMY